MIVPENLPYFLDQLDSKWIFLFSRLGMYRDAERQLKSALRDQDVVDTYLYLCKVYRRLDQPMTAVEVYKKVCLCVLCLPSLSPPLS